MLFNFNCETQRINNIIDEHAPTMTDKKIIETEIVRFKESRRRKDMFNGEKYYKGHHDIVRHQRKVIGTDGLLEVIENVPNNRVVDNQYKKMVDQKVNYLLGQPIAIKTDNDIYGKALKQLFNKKFMKLLKNICEDAFNAGIGWLLPYYNDQGAFLFKRFSPIEIIPLWADVEHTVLDGFIRLYEIIVYKGDDEELLEKVEVYSAGGINRFILDGGTLKPDDVPFSNYFTATDGNDVEVALNWEKTPLIAFKYNNKEIPLIKMVKTLQDGLNSIISTFQNNMEEDSRNTILVLKNYDGTNLAEFRKNLALYGAVKVKTNDGKDGGVDTLTVEVDADNYKAILEIFKKAIIENANGYDAKDDRMSGTPNQMNIQSMYSDIDTDANGMETEFQASFEELLWFVNIHLFNSGMGDFENEEVEVIFNRDILINESEAITNCTASVGLLSDETIIAQHPWVDDVQKEIKRMKEQKAKDQAEQDQYANAFPTAPAEVVPPVVPQ